MEEIIGVGKLKKREIIQTDPISPGYTIGKAFFYTDILTRNVFSYNVEKKQIEKEFGRIKQAFEIVSRDLHSMKELVEKHIGEKYADIFKVHKQLLKDETLLLDIEKELKRELVNAEHVVKNVFRKWANRFRMSESEMVRDKAEDMEDLGRRILRVLLGYEKNMLEKMPPDSIICASRLLPSDTVHIKGKNAKGIFVENGSRNSHSAILARNLGIPAVANPRQSIYSIEEGASLILDGEKGVAIVNPDQDDISFYESKMKDAQNREKEYITRSQEKAKTSDGKIINVYANIISRTDVTEALRHGCDGIGLFRIEQIYLESKVLPSEAKITSYLEKILKGHEKLKTTIRLLDVGGDKKIPGVEIEDELSTYLGMRGVRLLVKNRFLLETQLKALINMRKNYDIRTMIPMVTLPREVRMVREAAEDCRRELSKRSGRSIKPLKIGTMIETPAAIMNIEKIAGLSDFLSIGTNDLIQYMMAAGREDKNVAEYYEEGARLAMRHIKKIVKTAEKHNIECSICGEIAGDLRYTQRLISAGIRSLSVAPFLIPRVKNQIKKSSFQES
ncbi:MAG: phosphoenolpyruvate--protein phosphotransferase [Candidatus Omnitrophica bacterium]|nr:phosphoenolpyruvate--protein phosphotransferase [Candidatus Omnitrophota bacterium]